MSGPQPDDWVTIREAAEALDIPLWRARRLAVLLTPVWRDGPQGPRSTRRYLFAAFATAETRSRERLT